LGKKAFTSTSLFPDVNVWVALAHPISPHHKTAVAWAATVTGTTPVYFCRFTQLGLLRMLTTSAAMGAEVMTQAQSWKVLDVFLENPNITLMDEPLEMDRLFRRRTERDEVSPKQWADGYMAAFAEGHRLQLVTFDKALAAAVKDAILLRG
jgi:uncharacterized protein